MNDELLNCFLRPDASVTEWESNLLFKSLFSKIASSQSKIDSYNWLRSVNDVCLSTQRFSHSRLNFFLSDSVAISVIVCSTLRSRFDEYLKNIPNICIVLTIFVTCNILDVLDKDKLS